ncbi:MAG: hypothetical protein LBG04_03575 [Holosporaceae bacterium]|nr:hypothetical protein [Holosporaceae bacterium]
MKKIVLVISLAAIGGLSFVNNGICGYKLEDGGSLSDDKARELRHKKVLISKVNEGVFSTIAAVQLAKKAIEPMSAPWQLSKEPMSHIRGAQVSKPFIEYFFYCACCLDQLISECFGDYSCSPSRIGFRICKVLAKHCGLSPECLVEGEKIDWFYIGGFHRFCARCVKELVVRLC